VVIFYFEFWPPEAKIPKQKQPYEVLMRAINSAF
jgi:hypothetical protein